MTVWQRLAAWACPPQAVTDIGRVHWKLRYPSLSQAAESADDRIVIGLQLPFSVVEQSRWVRWPSMDEWMQMRMREHAKLVEERLTAELRASLGQDNWQVRIG